MVPLDKEVQLATLPLGSSGLGTCKFIGREGDAPAEP